MKEEGRLLGRQHGGGEAAAGVAPAQRGDLGPRVCPEPRDGASCARG